MNRKLSSNLTPVYKFCFPGLWVSCALYSLTDYILNWGDSTLQRFFAICLFWVGGGFLMFFSFGRLKSVYMEGDALYVSNFLKQIRIPFDHIETVKESDFWTSKISKVVLILTSTTPLGKRIEFSPAFSAKKIVNELKSHATGLVAAHPRAEA